MKKRKGNHKKIHIMATVYKITNTINGFVYVGSTMQTLHKRWGHHVSSLYNQCKTYSPKFIEDFKQYGLKAFKIETIIETDVTKEELKILEQHYIEKIPKEKRYNRIRAWGQDKIINREERKHQRKFGCSIAEGKAYAKFFEDYVKQLR